MAVDDSAYAVIPKTTDFSVLLIRQRDSNEHIKYALESLEGVTVF